MRIEQKLRLVGFEPTRANTVGLKSTSLDHSDKGACV